jgi:hypothetical protein
MLNLFSRDFESPLAAVAIVQRQAPPIRSPSSGSSGAIGSVAFNPSRHEELACPTLATENLWSSDGASAQAGPMMNGGIGGMGGYVGYWVPVLLVAVVGLVAWIVMQRRK